MGQDAAYSFNLRVPFIDEGRKREGSKEVFQGIDNKDIEALIIIAHSLDSFDLGFSGLVDLIPIKKREEIKNKLGIKFYSEEDKIIRKAARGLLNTTGDPKAYITEVNRQVRFWREVFRNILESKFSVKKDKDLEKIVQVIKHCAKEDLKKIEAF